jgi:hypothetical protein
MGESTRAAHPDEEARDPEAPPSRALEKFASIHRLAGSSLSLAVGGHPGTPSLSRYWGTMMHEGKNS